MSTVNYDPSFSGNSNIRGNSDVTGNGSHHGKFDTNGAEVRRPVDSQDSPERRLHRVSEVRQQQGASVRSVSRRMNLTHQEVRDLEDAGTDLRISDLLRWQEILEVPLADLLIDSDGPLSAPVHSRASMLRVMKTAKAIEEAARDRSTRRLAEMLIGQLVQIMPELADVSAWHSVGQRRTQDEMGRIVDRSIPDNFFGDASH